MTDTTAKRFSRNIRTLAFSRILFRVVSIGVSIYLVRELGTDMLGRYLIVMNLLYIFGAFADLGISNLVIRDVSRNKALVASYLDNFFVLQIAAGLLIIILIVATGFLSGYSSTLMIALAVGSVGPFFSGLSFTYNALLSAHERIYPSGAIEIVGAFVFLVGNLSVVFLGEGVLALVAVTVVVALVRFAAFRKWAGHFGIRVGWKIRKETLANLISAGLPFLLFNGAYFALQRLDILILSWLVEDAQVGVYGVSSRMVYASFFLITLAGTTLYPVFSRLMKDDPSKARVLYRNAAEYLVIISLFISLVLFVTAPWIIDILYGVECRDSVPIMMILAWFIPLYAAGLLAVNGLMAGGAVWDAVRVTVFAVAMVAVSQFILVPSYGITGAGIATVAGQGIAAILYVILAYRRFNWSFGIRRIGGVVVSLLASVSAWYLLSGSNAFIQVICPIVLFPLSMFLLKILTFADASKLMRIFLGRQIRSDDFSR